MRGVRRPPEAVRGAGRRGRRRHRLRSQPSSPSAAPAARDLADGARRPSSTGRSPTWRRCSSPGDIVIDGGNSHYHDDLRRAAELARHGIHYVDVGTSGGVCGLERGYCLMIGGEPEVGGAPRPDLRRAGARGSTPRRARRARGRRAPARAEQGYLHCGPSRRRALREDGPQRHRVRADGRLRRGPEHPAPRQRGADDRRRPTPKPRRCAIPSTTSYDLDLAEVAEVWRRGSVIASWLLDLTAARAAGEPRPGRASRGGSPTPAKGAGRSRPPSTRRCPRRC